MDDSESHPEDYGNIEKSTHICKHKMRCNGQLNIKPQKCRSRHNRPSSWHRKGAGASASKALKSYESMHKKGGTRTEQPSPAADFCLKLGEETLLHGFMEQKKNMHLCRFFTSQPPVSFTAEAARQKMDELYTEYSI